MFTPAQRERYSQWISEFERLWPLMGEAVQRLQHRHRSAREVCTDPNCWYYRREHVRAQDLLGELDRLYKGAPPGITLPEKLQFGGGGLGPLNKEPMIVPDGELDEITTDYGEEERSVSVSAGVGPPIIGDNPERFDSWGWTRKDPRPPPSREPLPDPPSTP